MKTFICFILLILCFCCNCESQNPVLWGMTSAGGIYNKGTIFYYDSELDIYKKVYDFGYGQDGSSPWGSLVQASNGVLYGMTNEGGIYNGDGGGGTIFEYNIATGNETILHSFGQGTDGTGPRGSLIQGADGILYGMASFGGGSGNNYGMIFSYNIQTNAYVVLHKFDGHLGGYNPYGSLLQGSNGLLYGTTISGGAADEGVVFSYNISDGNFKVLHNFVNENGGLRPECTLLQGNDSLLFGITAYGGIYDQGGEQNGGGIIFSYNISTGAFSVLYNFANGNDGSSGISGLVAANNGLFYGMTRRGGDISTSPPWGGTIFSFDTADNNEKVIHSFGKIGDGSYPTGSPMQASDGNLYGMTSEAFFNYSGDIGGGVLFKYNPANGEYLNIHNFEISGDGATPLGSLIEANIPNLFPEPSSPFQVFPNPSAGLFTFKMPVNTDEYDVNVYTLLGQKIESAKLSFGQNTINLINQPNGVYYVSIQTMKGIVGSKLVLVH